jgi:[acyl-carrier-protein] S-malonyltransferase
MLFVFPGQGSQKVGMGKDVYDAFQCARDVFHEVDDAISFKLSQLIFEGTEEDLKHTENAQPAIMTVSIALAEVLKHEFGIDISKKATFFAGHSLGEYSALCAAGVITLSETARLLRLRGAAMAAACPSEGKMAAIIGLNFEKVEKIVSEIQPLVQIANDNSPEQIIISGYRNAVEMAMEQALACGAKRALALEVSGPFHCQLMEKAAVSLAESLETVTFRDPAKPIIANVTAKAELGNFKDLLLKQITELVRWRESIIFAKENGVSRCVEIGPGRVLAGLTKRITDNIDAISVNSVSSIEALNSLNL